MPVYSDAGNTFVASLVPLSAARLLDIGCGSGDTARLIKARSSGIRIEGITLNKVETREASKVLDRVHTLNIESDPLDALPRNFDCLVFSHVLEHVRDPVAVLQKFCPYLVDGGAVVIAVPNVLEWRTRWRFLLGDWTYSDYGVLDRTHLTFVTYRSAERTLLGEKSRTYTVLQKIGNGSVPLGPLRRFPVFASLAHSIDRWGVRKYPNLFAQQVAIVARKKES